MEKIKELRLEIDKYINSTRLVEESREVSLAHTNLQRSKMWLGKAMGTLGSPTPYPQSDNATNNIIEKQAEHTSMDLIKELDSVVRVSNSDLENQTAMVKEFRKHIQETIDGLTFLGNYMAGTLNNMEFFQYFQQSVFALEEAKMWFGMELNSIREKQTS